MSEKKYYKLEYDEDKGISIRGNIDIMEVLNIHCNALASDISLVSSEAEDMGEISYDESIEVLLDTLREIVNSDTFEEEIRRRIKEDYRSISYNSVEEQGGGFIQ